MKVRAMFILLVSLMLVTLLIPVEARSSSPTNRSLSASTPFTQPKNNQPLSPNNRGATDSQNVELVGQIGGETKVVVIQGNYAYVGIGPRLVILNVTTPSQPVVAGQTGVFPNVIQDVAVAGNYAYVTDLGGELHVVNISNPAVPIEVGFYDMPGPHLVAVAGNYAYVADWYSGLRVMDVSNPAAPIEVGFPDTPGQARSVVVAGNYAYVADGYSGLRVMDVSNPTAPIEVGFHDTPGDSSGVVVVGNYAYVADRDSGLRVVDVSNPAAPIEVGFHDMPGSAYSVTVAGNYAYVADWGGGLRVVNVSNPVTPTEVGFYDTPGTSSNVIVAGNYAHVADRTGGLRIVNVSNPAVPTEVGFYDTPSSPYGVAVAGTYAYVADGSGGLHVVNISNPTMPIEAGFYDTPGSAYSVAVAGNYAYVADGSSGLRVVNVSNPVVPTEVGYYDAPQFARGVAVAGNYAYVADGSGLYVVNISNPAMPITAGFYDTLGTAYSVAVAGNYAYVADGYSGLRVINVSNPAVPTEVGFHDTPGSAQSVAVAENYAYIADWDGGLRVINVTNPAVPIEVGFYDTPALSLGVAVAGNYVYMSGGPLRVVNVSDPAMPIEVGFYDNTFGLAWNVVVAGNYIFMTENGVGLNILRYTGESETNLSVSHLEVTQGIQDEQSNVPLIANKPTFARIYVDCGEGCGSVPDITGVLRGYGPGGELPDSPRLSVNNDITVYHVDWTTQRDNLRKTLNFTLPLEWATGTITLTVEVGDSQHSETATFQEANSLRVIYVPIRYSGEMPDSSRIMTRSQWAYRVLPTHRINYVPGTTLDWDECLEDNISTCPNRNLNAQRLLNELTTMYDIVIAYVYGWLPQDSYSGGLAQVGGKAAFGDENVPAKDAGERIFAHEIAHLLGRRHTNTVANLQDTNCRQNPDPRPPGWGGTEEEWRTYVDIHPNNDWEFQNSKIQTWGLDAYGFGWLVSSSSALKNPDTTYDYMSYCGRLSNNNVWTSPWTYQKIFSDTLQSSANNALVQSLSSAEPYFIASGLVFTDDTATLDPVWIITTTTPAVTPSPGTEYCLEAQDAANTTQVSHCFDLAFTDLETGAATEVDGYHFTLPYPDGVARIVLKKGATVLSSQIVSPSAPDVTVLSPNGGESWAASGDYTISWTANDVDGDSLTYVVQYSADGTEWIPISGIITATQTTVNAAELPGGSNSFVRVLASDGINTSLDESDATFAVARKAPQALIVSPEGDGTIPPSTPLFLMGYSYDLEDGLLEGESLHWHSNRDGDLGTGNQILATLSPGKHIITFEATDSNNNSSTATLHIQVGYWVYLPVVVKP